MNIDVLSFSRLAHRIFEETGCADKVVLDDTGKSLVLRKVASELEPELSVLGKNLNKVGYIHEIKSVISEFKQYDVSPEKLNDLIEFSKSKGVLQAKLKDLQKVYEAFNNYTCNEFITSEETMTLLTEKLSDSNIIKDAVVVFDGFTGFTPVQYRLIQRLLELTRQVIVSVTIDINSGIYSISGEQELFWLSKKTIYDLQRISQEINVIQEEDVIFELPFRFKNNRELIHLERNLFRYPNKPYGDECESIIIRQGHNPEDEVREALVFIKRLVLEKGYEYRDIAVVCGNLSSYADEFERAGKTYDIPVFIDRTHSLNLNPFVECILGALRTVNENFSYDSMFHFLRSGLLDLEDEEIDRLDNYVVKFGISGKRKWSNAFTALPYNTPKGKEISSENIRALAALNETREKIMTILEPVMEKKGSSEKLIEGLYEFIKRCRAQEKLFELSEAFENDKKPELAREYSQIYRMIIELLDQIYALLKGETVTLDEFIKLLNSGIDELDVGTIPGGVDRIIVGDIERSRIGNIKVLMFLGVNDGNIPKSNAGGGIISDFDREFLKGQSVELSPTPREQIYTQRLYLYLNMTKPSDMLYVSYSSVGKDGGTLKESYLIATLKKLFPRLMVQNSADNGRPLENVFGVKDGVRLLSKGLREYAHENLKCISMKELEALLKFFEENDASISEKILDAAFFRYDKDSLSSQAAKQLYNGVIRASVSRFERYAFCQYAHFLQYGIRLTEREEFGFENTDLGSFYHMILQKFCQSIAAGTSGLADFSDEEAQTLLKELVYSEGVVYGDSILHSSAKNEYMLEKIYSVLLRTVKTIRMQFKSGSFESEAFEKSFYEKIPIGSESEMELTGTVDRIDLFKKDEKIYVKIVDYKSSEKDIELDELLYGLQIQQPLYMSAILKEIKRKYPEYEPHMGAMFYYHIDEPVISSDKELSDEEIEKQMLKELKVAGVMNSSTEVVKGLDSALDKASVKSLVIPAATDKDSELSQNRHLLSEEDLDVITGFADLSIKETGREIIKGHMLLNPVLYKDTDACEYCRYREICRFDERIDGYSKRKLPKVSPEEALQEMRERQESVE